MTRLVIAIFTLAVAISPLAVEAAEKTIVLDVKNADCVLCPPIVKESLARIPGVKTVTTKQASQMADFMATVTFDDAKTDVNALVAATTNAGYPSRVAR